MGSPAEWTSGSQVGGFNGQCEMYLKKFEDPKQSDPMSRIQNDLDETKIVLHSTIEAVLERGEKLDDLVDKSEALSMQSKAFYKTARKTKFLLWHKLWINILVARACLLLE